MRATDRIAAAHGSLNRIRQVAPMCTPMEYSVMAPTKRHLDRFIRFA